MLVEYHGEAMGTTLHVAAVGISEPALQAVVERIEDRDRRWTRFRDDSELAAINRAAGRPCAVAPDTARLVAAAVEAWHTTAGRFDPSIHDAMIAAGYDRTFAEGPGPTGPTERAPGPDDVQVDEAAAVLTVPVGVRLDLGGIGKGFAADLAVEELTDAGAEQAAVSIGGDVRVVGHPDAGWPIHAEPWPEPIAWLADGGFCFSTVTKRRWTSDDGGTRHHIMDPTTGRPTAGRVLHAAVAAANATVAESWATAAIVAGWPTAVYDLTAAGLDGFLITDDGENHPFGTWRPNPSILGASADRSRRE